jgi:soluble lytic murein transglycosylase-like protein
MPARKSSTLPRTILFTVVVIVGLAFARVARAQIFGAVSADGSITLTNAPGNPRLHLLVAGTPPAERKARESRDPTSDYTVFAAFISEASRNSRLPPELIRAVIAIESRFNPNAVSRKGAVGLMQLMPDTARRFSNGDMLNPRDNILAGAQYLRYLMDLFRDDLELALAAYNAGENAVIQAGNRIPAYAETQAYVPMVMAHYRKLLAAG